MALIARLSHFSVGGDEEDRTLYLLNAMEQTAYFICVLRIILYNILNYFHYFFEKRALFPLQVGYKNRKKVGYFQQKKTLLQSHFQAKHKLGFLPRNKAEWGISLKSVDKMSTEEKIDLTNFASF